MYRIIFLLVVSFGLQACRGNDKVVGAWEVNDVYRSTIISTNPSDGGKIYQGPPINTMDAANTYEMFSLRAEQTNQGAKTYELLVLLTYFSPWRYYESANLLNKPASTFKVVSREAGVCEQQGCVYKELMAIQVTDTFLREHLDKGFQVTISSKTGVSSDLFVPAQYIKGYLQAVDGPKN
ncbi:hypothetical protein C2740_02535 [Polynucleobacter sp. MG-5-Ahmo-C2]|uniref:hypothetical protein n=1 Tax=Polynucleobacter sp. MG-5-Ahmo-C2 TaxID=2081051 RepID=UPI001BFEC654|nr:hypothetical protein [Polynucleobacter sp. MG-5-Ahmo-C2]QWD98976.1 hypothetical protein C2740_02535 [Polynucleobacter sp. MG-5-Ahmo-C2]